MVAQARDVTLAEALRATSDCRVRYSNAKDFTSMCNRLGIMNDLKAGVPRTGYRGVVIIKVNGFRVFLTPSYRVDQDITKPLPP